MEKIAYLLSRSKSQDEGFCERIRSVAESTANRADVASISLCLEDEYVARAQPRAIKNHKPNIVAVMFVWIDSANCHAEIESELAAQASVEAAYLLSESEPLRESVGPEDGQRASGMMQVALLKVPENMSVDEWLSIWRNDHTQIAIDNQATTAYRQNLIVRSLVDTDPGYAAIVEEMFPEAAMDSDLAFYGATGEQDLATRQLKIWNSSKRFIKLKQLDVLPASEYVWQNRR